MNPLVSQPDQGLSLRRTDAAASGCVSMSSTLIAMGYSLGLLATARPDGAFNVTENDTASVQDWSYIADKIVTAPAEKWANVYLERFLTKEETVAAGGATMI